VNRAGDPGARGSTRRARAIVKSARSPSSSAPARDLLRPRKWNTTVKAGVCRSRLAGFACEDRRLVGVSARRIRLQKSANDAEVQRSAIPVAKERVDGDPSSVLLAREARSSKGVDNRHCGGKATGAGVGPSRVSERASRGEGLRKMEDIPGRLSGRSFTRAVLKAILAALMGQVHARASREPWERRQGCQRQGVHAS